MASSGPSTSGCELGSSTGFESTCGNGTTLCPEFFKCLNEFVYEIQGNQDPTFCVLALQSRKPFLGDVDEQSPLRSSCEDCFKDVRAIFDTIFPESVQRLPVRIVKAQVR